MDIKYLVYEEINESNSETIQQNNSFIKENTDTRISSISTLSYASKKKCNMINKNMQKFREVLGFRERREEMQKYNWKEEMKMVFKISFKMKLIFTNINMMYKHAIVLKKMQ